MNITATFTVSILSQIDLAAIRKELAAVASRHELTLGRVQYESKKPGKPTGKKPVNPDISAKATGQEIAQQIDPPLAEACSVSNIVVVRFDRRPGRTFKTFAAALKHVAEQRPGARVGDLWKLRSGRAGDIWFNASRDIVAGGKVIGRIVNLSRSTPEPNARVDAKTITTRVRRLIDSGRQMAIQLAAMPAGTEREQMRSILRQLHGMDPPQKVRTVAVKHDSKAPRESYRLQTLTMRAG
ncbi:MAG: hypothetical protein H7144_04925 [Burkholderiales bacterium]|nr:hypothetical protein [Phycisphaerae bacterium]